MNNYVIETKELCKHFCTPLARRKIKAIENLNLSIEPGEIFGFLGPNGAGKTTMIKILTNLLFPSSGQALLFNKPVDDMSVKRKIGYLPEHPTFYSHLTGYELLCFCSKINDIKHKNKKIEINELLVKVGLAGAENLLVSKYSKGMVQRLGLAQALINNPELVIFDEPLEGLDPLGRNDVKNILLELKNQGKTVFFSTHILPDVEVICDRVGILLKGKLISAGRIDEFLKKSIDSIEVTAQNLSEVAIEAVGQNASLISRFGKETQFIFTESQYVDAAVDLIRKYNGRLVSLQPHRKTLEEYFISQVLK